MKQYMTNGINPTPTIAIPISDTAFAEGKNMMITEIGGKGVKFAADGGAVLCSTAGEKCIGVVTIDNDVVVAKGDNISVQIKDNGLVRVAEAVVAGDELTVNADGAFVKATAGNFVRAIALANGKAGSYVRTMLVSYYAA